MASINTVMKMKNRKLEVCDEMKKNTNLKNLVEARELSTLQHPFPQFFLCQLISIITNIGGRSSDVVSLQIIDPLAFLSSLPDPISKSYGFLSLLKLGPILKLIKGNNNLLSFVTYH